MKKIGFVLIVVSIFHGNFGQAEEDSEFRQSIIKRYRDFFSKVETISSDSNPFIKAALVLLGRDTAKVEKARVVVREEQAQRITDFNIPILNQAMIDQSIELKVKTIRTKDHENLVLLKTGKEAFLLKLTSEGLENKLIGRFDNIKVFPESGQAEKVVAEKLLTLCDSCEKIEESDPQDVFKIPFEFSLLGSHFEKAKCPLLETEKEEMRAKFFERKKVDRHRAFWSSDAYSKFLVGFKKELEDALN